MKVKDLIQILSGVVDSEEWEIVVANPEAGEYQPVSGASISQGRITLTTQEAKPNE